MFSDLRFSVETDQAREFARTLFDALHRSNVERTNDGTIENVCVVARDVEGNLVGGIFGEVFWGWLHVTVLWVAPTFRRRGIGGHLLSRAEAEALSKGCHGSWLDTFTFQSVSFYHRAGYATFGTLEQFPNGQSRHFLRKSLSGGAP